MHHPCPAVDGSNIDRVSVEKDDMLKQRPQRPRPYSSSKDIYSFNTNPARKLFDRYSTTNYMRHRFDREGIIRLMQRHPHHT